MRPWIAALLLAGCASTPRQAPPPPAPPGAPEVRAARVATPPMVDGTGNDPAWAEVSEVEIPLDGVGGPKTCTAKAAVHGGTLFLLVRWDDPTEDREFGTYKRRNTENSRSFDEGTPDIEDVVELTLPMEGPFPADPLQPVNSSCDLWIWGASSTDPVGHAFDGTRRRSPKDTSTEFHVDESRAIFTPDREDGGDSIIRYPESKPSSVGTRFRTPSRPSGSASDVLGRGQWKDGCWTLELARALTTGSDDDRGLSGMERIPVGIRILDRCDGQRTEGYTGWTFPRSSMFTLILPPPAEKDRQGPFPEPRGGAPTGR